MKKRVTALLIAALMTLTLLPAGTLAAGWGPGDSDPDEFPTLFCGDGDYCMVMGCKGEGDPKHRTRETGGEFATVTIPLNLSSEGKNAVLNLPIKPGMTLNGFHWFPDNGPKGHALISNKDLTAVLVGETLIGAIDGLNKNDLAIANDYLYINQAALSNLGGNAGPGSRIVPRDWLQRRFNQLDPTTISSLEAVEYASFLNVDDDWLSQYVDPKVFRAGFKNTGAIKRKAFELAINGKPIGSATVTNIWPDKPVPFYDPDYAGPGDPPAAAPQTVSCSECNGAGQVAHSSTGAFETCLACGGAGHVTP